MPASAARKRTARPRKQRFARAATGASAAASITFSAAIRSAAKLS